MKEAHDYTAPAAGLGDTVAKVTKALGIDMCDGCNERRKLLNKIVPYAWRKKSTDDDAPVEVDKKTSDT